MKPPRPKPCPSCKKRFQPVRPLQECCNTIKCAVKLVEIKKEKKRLKEKKENRKAKLELDKNDYRKQFQSTKKAVQRLANRLDAGEGCICCGEPRGRSQFCGGHYKTSQAHPELALDLLNIHGQRNQLCNMQKSGNLAGDKHSHGYTQGLINRYGQWIIDYLESYHPPKNYTCDQLIQMRKEFNAEIRYIEKHGKPSKDWRKGAE
jgi:hypothetical protein